MNNQMLTKLNVKNSEIANLQKENNFLKNQLKSTKNDVYEITRNFKGLAMAEKTLRDTNLILIDELTKIKSHWLYKLIIRFKK